MAKPFDLGKIAKLHNKKYGVKQGFNDPITWIDTGNKALNRMISGDFNNGIPLGAVTVFAGESGSAKSYLVSGNIVRNALAQGINVVVIDTEDALKAKWVSRLGVDPNHPLLVKYVKNTVNEIVETINDFTDGYRKDYVDVPREEQPKILFVIDSLGFLETDTSVEQFEKGELKGDKGIKAKALKMLVSNCIRLFAGFEIGLVATNHTYKSQDMYNPDDVISGGCLIAGTKIWMADGSYKNVEDIAVDDLVKTMYGNQKVLNTFKYQKPTYTFELSDGKIIESSPQHKFLVLSDEGQIWKCAKDILENDKIIAIPYSNDPVRLKTKILIKKSFSQIEKPVFDFEVENDHHYIIEDGIVSHNSGFVFASSIIVSMNKKKLKAEETKEVAKDVKKKPKDIVGITAVIKCVKTRFSKPFEEVAINIPYSTGMDPYSGLFDMFKNNGIITQEGAYYSYTNKAGELFKLYRKDMDNKFFDMIMNEFPSDDEVNKGFDLTPTLEHEEEDNE